MAVGRRPWWRKRVEKRKWRVRSRCLCWCGGEEEAEGAERPQLTRSHPNRRIGETGYYLATFEAAVEHIKMMGETDEEREAREAAEAKEDEEAEQARRADRDGQQEQQQDGDPGKQLEALLAGSGFLS